MKQKLSKWLFALLAVCLMVSVAAPTVLAADEDTTTVKLTVTYGQTEAREMLDLINKFRGGE